MDTWILTLILLVVTFIWILPISVSFILLILDITIGIKEEGFTVQDLLLIPTAFLIWSIIMIMPIINYKFIAQAQRFAIQPFLDFKLYKGKQK